MREIETAAPVIFTWASRVALLVLFAACGSSTQSGSSTLNGASSGGGISTTLSSSITNGSSGDNVTGSAATSSGSSTGGNTTLSSNGTSGSGLSSSGGSSGTSSSGGKDGGCSPTGQPLAAPCNQVVECACGLQCFQSAGTCQQPCSQGTHCPSGTFCDGNLGYCRSSLTCNPNLTNGAFTPCITNADCACPFDCEPDPGTEGALSDGGASSLCEFCDGDGGNCQSMGGNCVPADPAGGLPPGLTLLPSQCASDSDCLCPDGCRLDPNTSLAFCTPPAHQCFSSDDCHDPSQICSQDLCVTNFCAAGSYLGQPCDSTNGLLPDGGSGDGTCELAINLGQNLKCAKRGSLVEGMACDPQAARRDLDGLCQTGDFCHPTRDGGVCTQLCVDPFSGTGGDPHLCNDPLKVCLTSGFCVDEQEAPGTGLYLDTAGDIPCVDNKECPPSQTCQGALCELSPCSELGAACDSSATGDGTCVYFGFNYFSSAAPLLTCQQAGTSTGRCDLNANRFQPELLCPVGQDCIPVVDGGVCEPICNSSSRADGGCSRGQFCSIAKPFGDSFSEGTCLPASDSGCSPAHPFNEFEYCRNDGDCACGLECAIDPVLSIAYAPTPPGGVPLPLGFCERPCESIDDCPLPYDACLGHLGNSHCQLNTCAEQTGLYSAPPTVNSTVALGSACTAGHAGGGTCLLVQEPLPAGFPPWPLYGRDILSYGLTTEPSGSLNAYGIALCYRGGTANGSCDPSAGNDRPDLLCPPGTLCSSEGLVPWCTSVCAYNNESWLLPYGWPQLVLDPPTGCSPTQVCVNQLCLPALAPDAGA